MGDDAVFYRKHKGTAICVRIYIYMSQYQHVLLKLAFAKELTIRALTNVDYG